MKILFFGRKSVGADALAYLSTLHNVEVVGVLTDNHLSVSPTYVEATRQGLTVFSFDEAREAIHKGNLSYDLGLSMLYWRKLGIEFIEEPILGTINFHPAPLPEYKGTGGYNLAILEGLSEWAVSAHYVDDKIDTGDIISVNRFPIDSERETVVSLERTCRDKLLYTFKTVVNRVLTEGKLQCFPNVGGHYTSRAQMEAMKEIRPGDDIERKIRAFWFPPYDGAYITMGGKKYTLVCEQILQQLADPDASSLFTTNCR